MPHRDEAVGRAHPTEQTCAAEARRVAPISGSATVAQLNRSELDIDVAHLFVYTSGMLCEGGQRSNFISIFSLQHYDYLNLIHLDLHIDKEYTSRSTCTRYLLRYICTSYTYRRPYMQGVGEVEVKVLITIRSRFQFHNWTYYIYIYYIRTNTNILLERCVYSIVCPAE